MSKSYSIFIKIDHTLPRKTNLKKKNGIFDNRTMIAFKLKVNDEDKQRIYILKLTALSHESLKNLFKIILN